MALRCEQMKAVPILVLLLIFGHTESGAVPTANSQRAAVLYPFGPGVGDAATPHEDDGMSPKIPLSEKFSFYGQSYTDLYVNNNGVVSFGTGVPEFTPHPFPLPGRRPFVAPYWADVDTRLGGDVFYRESRSEELLRGVARDIAPIVAPHPPTDGAPIPTWAFVATWDRVPFFGAASKKTNTFQAVLATDGVASFIILNYGDIQWTTGIANQGDPHSGLGGVPAQAGFNSGDDVHYYNIPGSRTPAVLHINRTSNIGVPGRWVFRVDEFTVTEGPPLSPTVPTPDPTTKRVSTEPTRPDDNGTEEREYICE
ncbi:sushi, nidogen and EGF-like domain-containing protein 1 [Gallus gallus]|uniref:sushi, nidogen and EGF-like domain-containing protein 1 n=1 Tax=Gallus gallus TaxID=9031 RepID=UPI001AE7D566|nr:sushi, nidogen and EGF-like domain-containing protein 1 [Gallus gallus]